MIYEFNIGLRPADPPYVPNWYAIPPLDATTGDIEVGYAIMRAQELLLNASDEYSIRVDTSGEEPTLVIRARLPALWNGQSNVTDLARALRQDCIAVYMPAYSRGVLIGPLASKWGPFDINRFIRA